MTDPFDAIVIGAGTAGTFAAARLAETGRRVLLLESRRADDAGARWVNGLPLGELGRLGIAPPAPERAHPFHLIAGWGPERVTIDDPGLVDHDMRALVAALHAQAEQAGVELRFQARVTKVIEAPDGVRVQLREGPELRSALLIDAAGMTGPTPRAPCPPHRICVAAQEVREVADRDEARAWLARHRAMPGETLSFSGIAGGYSIVNAHVTLGETPAVSLLTGSIPGLGHAAGPALLNAFVRDNPWIGGKVFGGARPIPLTAPEPCVGRGRVARLGDAARQVYASHGSGIAMGLRAAALLARTIAEGGGCWDYNVRFQRTEGAVLAASAAVAAWMARLDLAAVRELIASGLLHPALIRDGLRQLPPRLDPSALPDLIGAATRAPARLAGMAPALIAAVRLQAAHHRYPSTPERLPRWHATRHRLLIDVGAA